MSVPKPLRHEVVIEKLSQNSWNCSLWAHSGVSKKLVKSKFFPDENEAKMEAHELCERYGWHHYRINFKSNEGVPSTMLFRECEDGLWRDELTIDRFPSQVKVIWEFDESPFMEALECL